MAGREYVIAMPEINLQRHFDMALEKNGNEVLMDYREWPFDYHLLEHQASCKEMALQLLMKEAIKNQAYELQFYFREITLK